MDLTLISDLHGHFPQLQGGDLLIVAGDLTATDTQEEHFKFYSWLFEQNYKRCIFIGGNHDNSVENRDVLLDQLEKITYLCDSGTEFEGLKIWGCPHSLIFDGINPRCAAFTGTEEDLKKKYDLIPDDIDILISHTPFLHMLDQNIKGYHCGSIALRNAVDRVKPRLFVCGHLHEQGNNQLMYKHAGKNTWCVNASHVNERYQPVNKPIRIEL